MYIKDFDKVKVGDEALHAETSEPLGEIKWKGKFWKGYKQNHITVEEKDEWKEYLTEEELKKLEVVIVELETFGHTLFAYNFDPSSAFVEEIKSDDMDVSLKIVMMSHLSDTRHELGFISGSVELSEDTKECIERINKRLNFLSYLVMNKINNKENIYPETEFKKFEELK